MLRSLSKQIQDSLLRKSARTAKIGINRISLVSNLQTQKNYDMLERAHNFFDVIEAVYRRERLDLTT